MYMILPETETTAWLPMVGLFLVCLPWFFWILTFFYRVISRACGFRVSLGVGVVDGGAGVANASSESPRGPSIDNDDEDGHGGLGDQKRNSTSSSRNSAVSRESEMPLAITMAS